MNKKLWTVAAGIVAVLALSASSCDNTTSGDRAETQLTERAQRHFGTAQAPHAYDASQARDNLIAAHDAMALGADTWTVQYVEGVGVTFQCPSVGFPIPFGTNLTNPERIAGDSYGRVTVPMMEPYGLYPPADVAATYANCVLPNGTVGIFYSEPLLTTYGFEVRCDQETRYCTIPPGSEAVVGVTRVTPEDVNVREATEESVQE